METEILKTQRLTKLYGRFKALNDVSITLKKGHIYGFIGENGAGKSTLLKIITGLSFPDSGTLSLFGETEPKQIAFARKRIGGSIEEPCLYPMFTALENLERQRILAGNPDKTVSVKCLSLVGLEEAGKKKARDFSMGMKQRLSLALCLVNNPEFLILDEPSNGLDPKGMKQLRQTFQDLHTKKNMTLLVSSHILDELYQIATDYIIIHKGTIMECLSQEELDLKCRRYLSIRMDQPEIGITVLENTLGANRLKVMEDGSLRLYEYIDQVEKVARVLSQNGVLVTNLSICGETLEHYYLSLTGGNHDESDKK